MFHTYVLNAHSVPIDIDRARFLAVKDLWNQIARECQVTGRTDPQELWDDYCYAHSQRYGEPFPPQVRREPF